MQTKQIVQTSANVIRITSIAKGNIYKRFDDNYTWYGVVKGVHNDGEKTIIEATEYRCGWSSIEVQEKVIKGDQDFAIFPAELSDFEKEFDGTVERLEDKIEKAREEIAKMQKQIEFTKRLISGEMQKELSVPEYKEMPQAEYVALKAQI